VVKRLFWLAAGFVLGIGSSWAVARRVRRVATRLLPPGVVDRWSATVRAAVDEGRSAMHAREAQLKGAWPREHPH
jgi:hypothetical protein